MPRSAPTSKRKSTRVSPKSKPSPSPSPSHGNISKPREAGWQHAAYECDNCARPITLVSAQCVTNATEHLHACSDPACVTKLEQRLGTSDYDINVKPGDIG